MKDVISRGHRIVEWRVHLKWGKQKAGERAFQAEDTAQKLRDGKGMALETDCLSPDPPLCDLSCDHSTALHPSTP
jgi:hypothetical protein